MPRSEGWFVLLIAAALLYAAVNVQSGWLFVVDFTLLAFCLAAWGLPFFWVRAPLSVERFLPRVFQGEKVEGLLRVTNLARGGRYFLILQEGISLDGVRIPTFFFPSLPPEKTVEVSYREVARRRGFFPLSKIKVKSLGPAGFFEWSRWLPCPGELVVYPTSRPFAFSVSPLSPSPSPGEKGRAFGKGGDEEFFGVREYEAGDNMRAIHWPSSAKAGKLMIREMSRTHPALITAYVNRDRSFRGDCFEECVKLAAYAIHAALKEGHSVRMFRHGRAEEVDRLGSLEELARMEADDSRSLGEAVWELLPVFLAQRELLFFSGAPRSFRPEAWRFVEELQLAMVGAQFVLVGERQEKDCAVLGEWLEAHGMTCTFVPLKS